MPKTSKTKGRRRPRQPSRRKRLTRPRRKRSYRKIANAITKKAEYGDVGSPSTAVIKIENSTASSDPSTAEAVAVADLNDGSKWTLSGIVNISTDVPAAESVPVADLNGGSPCNVVGKIEISTVCSDVPADESAFAADLNDGSSDVSFDEKVSVGDIHYGNPCTQVGKIENSTAFSDVPAAESGSAADINYGSSDAQFARTADFIYSSSDIPFAGTVSAADLNDINSCTSITTVGYSTASYVPASDTVPDPSLLAYVVSEVNKILSAISSNWMAKAETTGVELLFLSRTRPKALQREMFVSAGGSVDIFVHRTWLQEDHELWRAIGQPVQLTETSAEEFVAYLHRLTTVNARFPICCGVAQEQYKKFWNKIATGVVDENPFQETRYTSTCRSHKCALLVTQNQQRCKACMLLHEALRKRGKRASVPAGDRISDCKTYKNMTKDEVVNKAKLLHLANRNYQRTLNRLRDSFHKLMETRSMVTDTSLDGDLKNILNGTDLLPARTVFGVKSCFEEVAELDPLS